MGATMQGKYTVLGASRNKGEYEGRPFEYTKIRVIGKALDDGTEENVMGWVVNEMRAPYELFGKFASLPADYTLTVELVGNGNIRVVDAEKSGPSYQFVAVQDKKDR